MIAQSFGGSSGDYALGAYDDNSDGLITIPECRYVIIDWDAILAYGFVAEAHVWGRRDGSAVWTPQIWNATDGAEAVAGSAISSSSFPAAGSEQVLTIAPLTGVKEYLLRGKSVSSSAGPPDLCYAFGFAYFVRS